MSSTTKRQGDGLGPYVGLAAISTVIVVLLALWGAAAAGAALTSAPGPGASPFAVPFALLRGSYTWPGVSATVVLLVELVAVAALVAFVVVRVRRGGRRRLRIDAAARHMARGKDLAPLSQATVAASAARFGAEGRAHGVFLGRTVLGHQPLYGSLEDTHVDIWGTRRGKTTSKAIPALIDHGRSPALCTSNRRDIVDATRLPRSDFGTVWVFDLQGLVGEEQTWWWNPLSYVTDVTTASILAGHFASDTREAGASTDAYFDPEGQDLVANFLLAAALGGHPITDVYRWTTDPRDETPEQILHDHGSRYALSARAVRKVLNAPDKQRAGVYGTAAKMLACLRNPDVTRWVTPPDGLSKALEFNPREFVQSSDTLYLISREGRGSAGALVTALTVAVCEAAEQLASRSPLGRLPRELLAMLDEAANVCKWIDLPDVYSHYGSRGILLDTILQSWKQGVRVWGEDGMAKLWSSANVATYGGGVRDDKFLSTIVNSVGPYELVTRSTTYQPGQGGGLFGGNRSYGNSPRDDEILNIADLQSMERGRVLVMSSGTRPTLVRPVPWWEREFAGRVQDSLNLHDPGSAEPTSEEEAPA